MANPITTWWETGEVGTLETSIVIDKKSIIYLALVTIITAVIIILIAREANKS